ncbi:hypothetical protein VP01_132g6 [Puccinia sorghi]|uniref:Uncharacterized protein n=1 Tax=Puccinia sorghi TaxID=27349 RepID=A0A0L6VMH1_9BASI|nr:hypothetical protein VP01_132g6 [Puccinia sorghi]
MMYTSKQSLFILRIQGITLTKVPVRSPILILNITTELGKRECRWLPILCKLVLEILQELKKGFTGSVFLPHQCMAGHGRGESNHNLLDRRAFFYVSCSNSIHEYGGGRLGLNGYRVTCIEVVFRLRRDYGHIEPLVESYESANRIKKVPAGCASQSLVRGLRSAGEPLRRVTARLILACYAPMILDSSDRESSKQNACLVVILYLGRTLIVNIYSIEYEGLPCRKWGRTRASLPRLFAPTPLHEVDADNDVISRSLAIVDIQLGTTLFSLSPSASKATSTERVVRERLQWAQTLMLLMIKEVTNMVQAAQENHGRIINSMRIGSAPPDHNLIDPEWSTTRVWGTRTLEPAVKILKGCSWFNVNRGRYRCRCAPCGIPLVYLQLASLSFFPLEPIDHQSHLGVTLLMWFSRAEDFEVISLFLFLLRFSFYTLPPSYYFVKQTSSLHKRQLLNGSAALASLQMSIHCSSEFEFVLKVFVRFLSEWLKDEMTLADKDGGELRIWFAFNSPEHIVNVQAGQIVTGRPTLSWVVRLKHNISKDYGQLVFHDLMSNIHDFNKKELETENLKRQKEVEDKTRDRTEIVMRQKEENEIRGRMNIERWKVSVRKFTSSAYTKKKKENENIQKFNRFNTFRLLGGIKYDLIHNYLINWFSKIHHFKNHGNAGKEDQNPQKWNFKKLEMRTELKLQQFYLIRTGYKPTSGTIPLISDLKDYGYILIKFSSLAQRKRSILLSFGLSCSKLWRLKQRKIKIQGQRHSKRVTGLAHDRVNTSCKKMTKRQRLNVYKDVSFNYYHATKNPSTMMIDYFPKALLSPGDHLWNFPGMCHHRGVSIGLVVSVLNFGFIKPLFMNLSELEVFWNPRRLLLLLQPCSKSDSTKLWCTVTANMWNLNGSLAGACCIYQIIISYNPGETYPFAYNIKEIAIAFIFLLNMKRHVTHRKTHLNIISFELEFRKYKPTSQIGKYLVLKDKQKKVGPLPKSTSDPPGSFNIFPRLSFISHKHQRRLKRCFCVPCQNQMQHVHIALLGTNLERQCLHIVFTLGLVFPYSLASPSNALVFSLIGRKGVHRKFSISQIIITFFNPLKKELNQLPAVDMQHAAAKLPSKLHLFACVDFLEQSLCSLHSDCASKLG